jgi:hypothetical protein
MLNVNWYGTRKGASNISRMAHAERSEQNKNTASKGVFQFGFFSVFVGGASFLQANTLHCNGQLAVPNGFL